MAPCKPLVAAFFKFAVADPLDEASMLQMPVVEKTVQADAADCHCPGYFEDACRDNAFQGCMWTDDGDSNAAHCQCDPEFVYTAPLYTSPSDPEPPYVQPACPHYFGPVTGAGTSVISVADPDVGHTSASAPYCEGSGMTTPCTYIHYAGPATDCHPPGPPDGCHRYFKVEYSECEALQAFNLEGRIDTANVFDANGVFRACADNVISQDVTCWGPPNTDPVSCVCPTEPEPAPPALTAHMGTYPGYSGDLQFMGSVGVDQSGDNLLLSWHLSGLEAELCASAPEGVGNACGIHIHSGSTCDDASGVGGHYYHEDMASDPWSPVVYTPDAFGDSATVSVSVATGKSLSDVLGRAIVVHDHTGGRVACGIIQVPPTEYEATMGRYPGYSGDLHFMGSVTVEKSDNDLVLSWHLSGLEAELCAVAPAGVGNACGIHIHSGSTCDEASGVGGHFYHEDMDADPWSPVVYTPDSLGDSTSSGNSIAIGYSLSYVLGRAIVVHDHTGGRVACGIIQTPPAATANMGAYPGYSGDLQFMGSVGVDQSGDNLLLSWHLSGLEAELCASAPEGVGNACGIHIHSGSTCDDASGVGGHYYHDDMASDPWSPVVYTPDAFGDSMSSGNSIVIGQSLSDVMGRAIVVHDHTGGRVACGIIS